MNFARSERMQRWMKLLAVAAIALAFVLGAAAQRAAADQPHMQAALDALQVAENQLQQASDDKGGHRRRALELVRRAQAQVEAGIKFDRRH